MPITERDVTSFYTDLFNAEKIPMHNESKSPYDCGCDNCRAYCDYIDHAAPTELPAESVEVIESDEPDFCTCPEPEGSPTVA